MAPDWRDAYARFLSEQCDVPEHQLPFYVHWVGRFKAANAPGAGSSPPEAVPRFLAALAREKAPWQVQQAEDAVRRYAEFCQRPDPGAPPRPSTEPPPWDHVEAEMVRLMRLRRLSLRTERSYLGWLRRFRVFTGAAPPADLSSTDVDRFLSHLAVDKGVSKGLQGSSTSQVSPVAPRRQPVGARAPIPRHLHDTGIPQPGEAALQRAGGHAGERRMRVGEGGRIGARTFTHGYGPAGSPPRREKPAPPPRARPRVV